MKKVLCLMAAAAITLAACNKVNEETPVKDPEIKLTSTEDITVSHEGGTAAIAYEIVNPVDGGMISAASQADWISDFNYDTEGEVTFTVAANTGTEKRNATVTLTYTYADGKTVNADANLVQNAYSENPVPEIKLGETEVNVGAEGGQSEIAVEILNPAEDGEISATADESWITVTSATATAIVLDIAENTETSARSGEVSVTYTYAGGEKAEAKITVSQEAGFSGPAPEITLGKKEVIVRAEGEHIEVSFEITNPTADGNISASADADWISISSSDNSTVAFDVTENTATSSRNASVTITYTYGGSKTVEATISVIQNAASGASDYDYDIQANWFEGYYYGAYGDNGEYNYFATFSDLGYGEYTKPLPGASYYILDFYNADAPDDTANPMPKAGRYTLSMETTDDMTFSYYYSYAMGYDDEGVQNMNVKFSEGYFDLSYEGSNMVVEASFVDESGKTHHFTFNKECRFFR